MLDTIETLGRQLVIGEGSKELADEYVYLSETAVG
jgi:hypothetical protein